MGKTQEVRTEVEVAEAQIAFTEIWMEYAKAHEDVLFLHDWAKTFAVLLGMVMQAGRISEAHAQQIADVVAVAAMEIYSNEPGKPTKQTFH